MYQNFTIHEQSCNLCAEAMWKKYFQTQCFHVIYTFYLHYFTFLTITLETYNNIESKSKALFTLFLKKISGRRLSGPKSNTLPQRFSGFFNNKMICNNVIISRYFMDFREISEVSTVQRHEVEMNVISSRVNKFDIQRNSMQYVLYLILLFKTNKLKNICSIQISNFNIFMNVFV